MMCSALLLNRIDHARIVLDDLKQGMDKHKYASIQEMRGILSRKTCPPVEAFERGYYMKVLQSFR
mgnify:CR=1 FL=1